MQLDDAANILSRADFFEICEDDQLRLLAFASERKKFRPGAVIYESGEVPDGAHVLISGTVATTQKGADDDPFLTRTEGAVIGAVALVVAKPRPVTVRAVDTVETLFVPRSAFRKLLQQYPGLAAKAADHIRRDLSGFLGAIETVAPKMHGGKG